MQRTKKTKPAAKIGKASKVATAVASVEPRGKLKKGEKKNLLPSGSTMMNLALADNTQGGLGAGTMVNYVGDSGVGKTMVGETILADAANIPQFDHYRLFLDDIEHAMAMNIRALFGEKAEKRIEAPRYDNDGVPVYSETVEQVFARIMELLSEGIPFIYTVDSVDALTDAAELELVGDLEKASTKAGGDVEELDKLSLAGSYGTTKPRLLSQFLRTIKGKVAKTDSIIIFISQIRSKLNAKPNQKQTERAGGRALTFYCSHVVWLSKVKTHSFERKLKGGKVKKIPVGAAVTAKVTKNKITGKEREVSFDIYYDYGIDDISSCVDFLIEQDVIEKSGAQYLLDAFGYEGKMYKKDLVKFIEDEDLLDDLKRLCQEAWDVEEKSAKLDRRPRYKS